MRERHRSNSLRVATAIVFATTACALLVSSAPLRAATTADAGQTSSPANGPGAVLGTTVFETRGQVVSVDPGSNSVTLSGERGRHFTFEVEPDVADVSKLAPGDQVDIVYRHALLLRVDRAGSSGLRSRVETTTTAPAMGGVTATTRHVEVTATIRKIDRARRELTLRGPTETLVLDVPPNVTLEDLRVGQKVRATYVTQSAVKVTRNGEPVH
jgi:Cu/Ag efflux protein CusF